MGWAATTLTEPKGMLFDTEKTFGGVFLFVGRRRFMAELISPQFLEGRY
jgi:hypothetical protein